MTDASPRGEPSVTVGAYAAVANALGWMFKAVDADQMDHEAERNTDGWIPVRIHLEDYPALAELAWQISIEHSLTPGEALDIYERNDRHLDKAELSAEEQALIGNLRKAFGKTDV